MKFATVNIRRISKPVSLLIFLISLPMSSKTMAEDVTVSSRISAQANHTELDSITNFSIASTSFRSMITGYHSLNHSDSNITWQLDYQLDGGKHWINSEDSLFQSDDDALGFNSPGSSKLGNANWFRLSDLNSLDQNRENQNGYFLNHQFDRGYIKLETTFGQPSNSFSAHSFSLGRQAIGLGLSPLISPIDILFPQSLTIIDTEYRRGIDTLRWQYGLDALSELEAAYVFSPRLNRDIQLLRYRNDFDPLIDNVSSIQSEFNWIKNKFFNIYGTGIQTSIGSVGFWAEWAGFHQLQHSSFNENLYSRASIGVDFQPKFWPFTTPSMTFSSPWLWQSEIHHNELENELTNYFYQSNFLTASNQRTVWSNLLSVSLSPLINLSYLNQIYQSNHTVNANLNSTLTDKHLFLSHHLTLGYSVSDESDINCQISISKDTNSVSIFWRQYF